MTTINRRVAKLETVQRQQDLAQAQRIVNFLRQNPDSAAASRIVEILDLAKARRDRVLALEKTL